MRKWTIYFTRGLFAIIVILITHSGIFASQTADKASNDQAIQAHIEKGIGYGNNGDFAKAIEEFKEILKIDPRNKDAYNNIGVAYFRMGDLDQTLFYYSKAIELGIADAGMYFFAGQIYGKYRGDYAKAIPFYSKAIELEPNFGRAYLNRALSYSGLQEYDKALADYNKMVELRPSDLKIIIDSRAQIYYEKGEYDKAAADVEKAKALGVDIDEDFITKLKKVSRRK